MTTPYKNYDTDAAQSAAPTPSAEPTGKLTISVAQLCVLLGIGKTSAYAAIRAGTIATVLVGRRRLVVLASVERLMEGNAQ